MSNLFSKFVALLPQQPLQVGTVLDDQNGVLSIELPGGAVVQARGAAAIGVKVFFKAGAVEALAPDLPFVHIDI